MMEGLTVLSQRPETVTHSNTTAIIVVAIILLIITIVLTCIDDDLFFGMLIFSAIIIVIVAAATSKTTETGKTIYKVTVNDSVSINEFYDRYKILDQEGLIYEIVEKGE